MRRQHNNSTTSISVQKKHSKIDNTQQDSLQWAGRRFNKHSPSKATNLRLKNPSGADLQTQIQLDKQILEFEHQNHESAEQPRMDFRKRKNDNTKWETAIFNNGVL